MRMHYYDFPENTPQATLDEFGANSDRRICRPLTIIKNLLKTYGGYAWTEHYDRDGGFFETSDITLGGNNSQFKYNRHL